MRYFGPFKVIAKVGEVAYKLELPATAKIHPVFHVSQLKEFKGSNDEPYIPLPLTTAELGPTFQPTAVLDTRMLHKNNTEIPQVLIQWGNVAGAEVKWEDFNEIHDKYPFLNLEDKVEFKGGGIVMKGNLDNKRIIGDSAYEEGVRKGSRTRVANTRLKDYIIGVKDRK
jgi:hypothetical protein